MHVYMYNSLLTGLTGFISKLPEEELKATLEIIPNDKLLVETDAPYMGFPGCQLNFPEYKDKKRAAKQRYPNLPSALPFVLANIAEVKGVSTHECAEMTTANALRFFGL